VKLVKGFACVLEIKSKFCRFYAPDFWSNVFKTVRPVLSDCSPVCLSVTLVYCQGRIFASKNLFLPDIRF